MSTINDSDKKKGEQGEAFFENIAARFFFGDDLKVRDPETGKSYSIIDLRGFHKEGEYMLPDGSLIEVKSDFMCHATGNIVPEVSLGNGIGWLQHCWKNGVVYLLFFLFSDISKPFPYRSVLFDLKAFASYVFDLMDSKEYMSRNYFTKYEDGLAHGLLKVNLEDAIRHCNPLVADTQECRQDIVTSLLGSINNGFMKKGLKVDLEPDLKLKECVLQLTYKEDDRTAE